MTTLISLLLLGGVLWFWQDSLRAREHAKAAGLRACKRCGVQLLDDTVALEKLRIRRDTDGRLTWERVYVFEFTEDGVFRLCGSIMMLGRRVQLLHMEPGDLLIP